MTTFDLFPASSIEASTSSPEASRARTPASPAKAPDSPENVPVSGVSFIDSSPSADPVGYSLRMCLALELEALTGCSLTWKRSATPHGRSWWVLGRSERRTGEIGSGLWPTASATPYGSSNNGSPRDGRERYATAGKPSMENMARQWPTATAGDANSSGSRTQEHGARETTKAHPGTSLTDATVRGWATPRAEDSESAGAHKTRGTAETLTAQSRQWGRAGPISTWATPAAQDHKNDTLPQSQQSRDTLPGNVIAGLPDPDPISTIGSRRASSLALNPAWVATLMGFPSDWCRVSVERLCALWETRSSRRSSKRSAEPS